MSFPIFNPYKVKLVEKSLTQWLSELPEDSVIRVFHTKDENILQTWLEHKESNTVYLVSEESLKA